MSECKGEGLCVEHTGQSEKIKSTNRQQATTNWMLGILISVILLVGGSLYTQMQALTVALTQVTAKLSAYDERFQRLEATDQRIFDRLDKLEGRLR